MKLLRYSEHSESIDMAETFINLVQSNPINESSDNYDRVTKKIVDDLKLNGSLVLTLGVGLKAMFPVVNELVENMKLKIDLNIETIVLMTIASITIAYLEELKESKEKKKFEKDSKSMLEELKLRGVGNNIVKKLVSCIKSIGNIVHIIFKNRRYSINGFFDMFGYASISVPIINAVLSMINKYDMNLETLPGNFLSLGLGITSLVSKHGLNYIIDKLKDKFKLDKSLISKSINDIDDPILKKYPHPEYIDIDYDNIEDEKLIKEQ